MKMVFESESDEVGYLYVSPRNVTKVSKTIRLLDLIPKYKGADLYLDFDAEHNLLGIEVLLDDKSEA